MCISNISLVFLYIYHTVVRSSKNKKQFLLYFLQQEKSSDPQNNDVMITIYYKLCNQSRANSCGR